MSEDVQKHSVHTLVFRSLKRTHDMFLSDQGTMPVRDERSEWFRRQCKLNDEYGLVKNLPKEPTRKPQPHNDPNNPYNQWQDARGSADNPAGSQAMDMIGYDKNRPDQLAADSNKALVAVGAQQALVPKKAPTMPKPEWHPPWKLYRIWDLATGTLKLSLTGHISAVRGVCVSPRQPYLFSCGEDKKVMCWDLEQNKVIRSYHGHLSAVYSIDVHPTIDIIATCGRDSTCRIWDMRTKACVHTLAGHTNTVAEIITGSHDCTIRLWDLAAGKSRATLTNHKKSVRALAIHPTQYTFASGSPDNIKQWKFPDGNFLQNMSGHNAIINSLALNLDNVLVSAADNGSMHFWDWKTGYNFQRMQVAAQPGSIDSEAGIFAMTFDHSSTRLITAEADKTIKIYKEDDTATEESHPLNWRPDIIRKKRY
ncbi:PLRG1-like protein [Mya arenaria]|uniref:PLRG1-like protein n=1 Tax=Mya arenaria TaxID=6604 RepID=A0ABY7DN85_MYAAR|nr:PLRG1-like protein [Mya arenaria]